MKLGGVSGCALEGSHAAHDRGVSHCVLEGSGGSPSGLRGSVETWYFQRHPRIPQVCGLILANDAVAAVLLCTIISNQL